MQELEEQRAKAKVEAGREFLERVAVLEDKHGDELRRLTAALETKSLELRTAREQARGGGPAQNILRRQLQSNLALSQRLRQEEQVAATGFQRSSSLVMNALRMPVVLRNCLDFHTRRQGNLSVRSGRVFVDGELQEGIARMENGNDGWLKVFNADDHVLYVPLVPEPDVNERIIVWLIDLYHLLPAGADAIWQHLTSTPFHFAFYMHGQMDSDEEHICLTVLPQPAMTQNKRARGEFMKGLQQST
ncbi:MAG: hypothetical protein EOO40_08260 [Deltaproteobacteria bacterium]|nr:MAG: hypothetical protein EOO40_08260 [Deltaproteobacteria bacterium]